MTKAQATRLSDSYEEYLRKLGEMEQYIQNLRKLHTDMQNDDTQKEQLGKLIDAFEKSLVDYGEYIYNDGLEILRDVA